MMDEKKTMLIDELLNSSVRGAALAKDVCL